MDGFVKRGGRLLVTGALPTKDGEGRECGTRLKCLPFTVEEKKPVDGYVLLQKRELYPSLPDTGLVGIIYDWSVIRPKERLEKQTVEYAPAQRSQEQQAGVLQHCGNDG